MAICNPYDPWGCWTTATTTCSNDTSSSTCYVWGNWQSSESTTVEFTDQAWYAWSNMTITSQSDSTTVTITDESTWYQWQTATEQGHVVVGGNVEVIYKGWAEEQEKNLEARQVREAQRARRMEVTREQAARDAAERERKAAELKKKREEAEKKAKDLLLDLIGEEQLKVYEETGRLFVKGKKYDYILKRGSTVQKIEKKKVIDLCVHLDNRTKFPETDNAIALKLMLENEEDKVLEMANFVSSQDKPKELPRCACGGM